MSRSGYSEGCDDNLSMGRWRGRVASSIRGKRGQAFLRDLLDALDAMPEKRLIQNELRKDGEMCTLGVLGAKRGINLEDIDPEDYEIIAAEFGIAAPLAQEIMYENDEYWNRASAEKRWTYMRSWVKDHINDSPKATNSVVKKSTKEE